MPDTWSDQSSVPASEDSNRHSWEPEIKYLWYLDNDPIFELNSVMWGFYLLWWYRLSVSADMKGYDGGFPGCRVGCRQHAEVPCQFKNTDSHQAKLREKLGKCAIVRTREILSNDKDLWMRTSTSTCPCCLSRIFDLTRHRHQVLFWLCIHSIRQAP